MSGTPRVRWQEMKKPSAELGRARSFAGVFKRKELACADRILRGLVGRQWVFTLTFTSWGDTAEIASEMNWQLFRRYGKGAGVFHRRIDSGNRRGLQQLAEEKSR